MILVDTSVWVDYFNGKKNQEVVHLDRILGNELVLIGDIILAEVLQGFSSDLFAQKAKKILLQLEYRDMLGQSVALEAAKIYRHLRKRGITPRKSIDVWIGAFCILNDVRLLHRDRDFLPLVKYFGLKTVDLN